MKLESEVSELNIQCAIQTQESRATTILQGNR